MSQDEFGKLGGNLDNLAQRIEERVQELKKSGRFPDDFEDAEKAIRARQERLRNRVAEAVRSGAEWEVVKAELQRDYGSLSDNALSFERQIDEQFAKNSK